MIKQVVSAIIFVILGFSGVKAYPSLYEYGVIMDAGSTGTRVHLYRWIPTSQQTRLPSFEEVYKKDYEPGISSFNNNQDGIQNYLLEIIKGVKLSIPQDRLNNQTSLYFMATAGLRLLGEDGAEQVLKEVDRILGNKSFNPFDSHDNVRILSGEEEALFSWLTVNYLSQIFQSKQTPYGIFEVGGGSAQIAFIPEVPIFAGKTSLLVAGTVYDVYTHSFSSYGDNSIQERIQKHFIKQNPMGAVIKHPCMLRGDSRNVSFNGRSVVFKGSGDPALCETTLSYYLLTAPNDRCSPKPCAIGSVYTPNIDQQKFIGLSSIYYTAKDLHVLDSNSHISPSNMKEVTYEYCTKTVDEAYAEYGIKGKWASANCQNGLYIPMYIKALGYSGNELLALKRINGKSVGWTLGALIYERENRRTS